MSIWFEGYGCTANQGETLEMRDHANQLGHELASSSDSAKTVVLGTCTVIESTQNKMERRISDLMDQSKSLYNLYPNFSDTIFLRSQLYSSLNNAIINMEIIDNLEVSFINKDERRFIDV